MVEGERRAIRLNGRGRGGKRACRLEEFEQNDGREFADGVLQKPQSISSRAGSVTANIRRVRTR